MIVPEAGFDFIAADGCIGGEMVMPEYDHFHVWNGLRSAYCPNHQVLNDSIVFVRSYRQRYTGLIHVCQAAPGRIGVSIYIEIIERGADGAAAG